jgi:UDP-3-O-[3-hydroxymyristoyl] glucosamine N-acyltransferase
MIGIAFPSPLSLARLADRFGGTVDAGAEGFLALRVAPLADGCSSNDLAPLLARRYLKIARTSPSLLLVDASLARLVPAGRRWIHPHAGFAFARLLADLAPPPPVDERMHARIDRGAEVHPSAIIGAGAVIRAGVVVDTGCRIEPNVVIYGGSRLGARVCVGAGAVIGRPGFGWTASPAGEIMRVPQLGGVIIEDDVEIGPLATIDAGTLRPTLIGRGAKLDAHVHVGHNGVVGAGSIIAAQCGFAGSVEIGAGSLIGGQAGIADHVRVGPGAKIAAKSGVIGDVEAGATVAGYPAVDRARWLRAMARALHER